MSVTNDEKDVSDSGARRLRRELFSDEFVDRLVASAGERGVALTGRGGFLPEMIKSVLERGMDAELTSHLGYERGDRVGHGSGNSRQGYPSEPTSFRQGVSRQGRLARGRSKLGG